MKTDTKDAIRVTITFRRESYVEWYDRLVDVKSGRARADIVRAQLSLPRAVQQSLRVQRQDPALTQIPTLTAAVAPVSPDSGSPETFQQPPENIKPGSNE